MRCTETEDLCCEYPDVNSGKHSRVYAVRPGNVSLRLDLLLTDEEITAHLDWHAASDTAPRDYMAARY